MQNNVVLKDINADLNLTLVQYSANVAGSTWCSCWLLCSCGCCESLATNSFARYLSRWLCTSFGPRVRAASCPQATRQRRSLCDRDVGQLRAAAVLGGIRRTFSLVCSLPSPPRSSRSHFASACRNSAASCARAACSRPLPERARSPSSTSTTSYVSHTSKSEQALLRLGDAHSGVAAPPHRTPRAGSRPWSSTCSRRRPRRACSSCRPPTAAKRHQALAPSHWHTSSRFTHTHMRACVPLRPFDYRAARDATNTPTSVIARHSFTLAHSFIRSFAHAHTLTHTPDTCLPGILTTMWSVGSRYPVLLLAPTLRCALFFSRALVRSRAVATSAAAATTPGESPATPLPLDEAHERDDRRPSIPLVRLSKALAASGVCSRRVAEEAIKQGRVTVDGVVVTRPTLLLDPNTADIRVKGAHGLREVRAGRSGARRHLDRP